MAGKKIYAFNVNKVKKQLVRSFRKQKNQGTIADLINYTGLPKVQVEETIPVILKEYNGHLKVNNQGDILYHFPHGMISNEKSFSARIKKFLSKGLSISKKILSFAFKIWIVVMLVGYFILFLALFLAALVASIAASASNRNENRRGSGFGAFWLSSRLIDVFIRVWFYSGMVRQRSKRGNPLHKSVFAYVFGEEDPNEDWEVIEKKLFFFFIQKNKGTITIEEFIQLTGYDRDLAQDRLNRYLLEFEGEPQVTEGGQIIYYFEELLKTTAKLDPPQHRNKVFYNFNNNKKSLNTWITAINGVNLLTSVYFLYYTLHLTSVTGRGFSFVYYFTFTLFRNLINANPANFIFWILGTIPGLFSLLFYLIPLIRNQFNNSKNEQIRRENYRKHVYTELLSSDGTIQDLDLQPIGDVDKPFNWKKEKDKEINRLSLDNEMNIENKGTQNYHYIFPHFKEKQADLKNYRASIKNKNYDFGESIFDSNNEEIG
ncbi:hypothetical protein [Spirochaeta cellobiosiphila]|uniref:hypothetical protein n=1 Tax=Spirochaeta cellobiosiphila TaxID=504483 RepID=UPI000412672A|nr:hypothetical protein [Spirochaeta cellobiosiphila]